MLGKISKRVVCLMAAGVMLGCGLAEAGTIPTSSVPLHTYAMKTVYCYASPGGARSGYIDPGDYVIITKVRGDGWVYGSYPVKNKRVSRWFKASDLLADRNANYTRYSPTAKTNVYKDSTYKTAIGWVNNNEEIIVVGGQGDSRQILYKTSRGEYKMGWVPYWDCWNTDQVPGRKTTTSTTIVKPTPTPSVTNQQANWDAMVGKRISVNLNNAAYNKPTNPFNKSYVSKKTHVYHKTNCTWYGFGRFAEVNGQHLGWRENWGWNGVKNGPEYWVEQARKVGYATGTEPRSKCVGVRETGETPHIVFVEHVSGNWVYITEVNTGSDSNTTKNDYIVQKYSIADLKNKKGVRKFIYPV